MKFTPEKHQVLFRDHLLSHDEAYGNISMGLGKTAGVLDAFTELHRRGQTKGMLVLAPLRVSNLVWPSEAAFWSEFRWMRVANLRTELGRRAFLNGGADLYHLNYESIPLLVNLVCRRGGTVPYDTIVYDEVDTAKSPKSKRINLLRRQVPRVQRNWGMTGTPIDRLIDLFAQFRLLDEGKRLGVSSDLFKKTYFHQTDYMGYKWEANDGAKERIEKKIADMTITMRIADWMPELSEAVVHDVEVPLGDALMKQYTTLEKQLIFELKNNVEISAPNAAALMTKLLQFTSGAIYDGEKLAHEVHTLKMDALRKIVKEADSPVLVAVSYKHEQDRIRKDFPQAVFFADAQSLGAQTDVLNRWNQRRIPMLVAHPNSTSHGLNMQQGGHNLVWTSLTYSQRKYNQMNARLARRGQPEVVKVHRLMCPGTVDDAIATVLEEKRDTEQRLLSALMLLEGARDLPPSRLKAEKLPDWY